ncbi:MAG TPA: glucosamine-6-phosphate deaminase [Anaerolineaceae bacterium]
MNPVPILETTLKGIRVKIFRDKDAIGQAAATKVASVIRAALAEQGSAAVIFATGASQYEFLASLIQAPDIDWTRVTGFHLDEYIGMDNQHNASFRRYLRERLFSRLPFKAVHYLEGDAPNPQLECARYQELLLQQEIDLACIGIGENGHLAFNDPPADFRTPYQVHVVNLDERCRLQQVGEGHFPTLADVPKQALSLSIPAILRAKSISCVVPDLRKAEAVRCALAGSINPHCPASALQLHPNVDLYLDGESASLLSDLG